MLLRGFGDDNPVGGCAQRRYLRASCMNACESRHECVLPPLRLLGLMVERSVICGHAIDFSISKHIDAGESASTSLKLDSPR